MFIRSGLLLLIAMLTWLTCDSVQAGVVLFGQAPSGEWAPLINLGAVGLVLAWFLWKAEPRMKRIEDAINMQSKAVLLLTISSPTASPEVRKQAQELKDEIDHKKKDEPH